MLMTGETDGPPRRAPAPVYAPAAYAQPAPALVYAPQRANLPQAGLPDYTPQPPAYYGSHPEAQAVPQQQAYAQQAYAQQTYAPQNAAYDPLANDPGLASRPINPIYQRQDVAYEGHERPGTIIIDTPEKFLFLVQPGGRALRYGIGVGRPGFAWAGVKTISRKAEWPGWTPPPEMVLRRPDLPRHMDGGPANPLGARALYLGSSLYRIHGTNEPYTIGTNVSSGCIRMMNEDVVDLYGRVGVGTRVIVM
ncbi:L,D-transpeptidase [Beijerinckia sp. L45]|uniref:L,D-transpeptidase n=1 Tax=Beijerinckia sp. L45 TaxID=1641855 RepID=UPI0015768C01|nr:L,D-transpeptidase [Beijerinckia sp. L45]